jgi:hypothetical protein
MTSNNKYQVRDNGAPIRKKAISLIKLSEERADESWADQMNAEEDLRIMQDAMNTTVEEDVDENEEKDNNSGAEEAAEEEEDEEDDDEEGADINTDDIIMEKSSKDCCLSLWSINLNNLNGFVETRAQFLDTYPDIGCLSNLSLVGKSIMKLLNSSTNLPSNVGYIVKEIAKHRHDFFAYFICNFVIDSQMPYGTDMGFKYIDSNRTPDAVIYDEDNKIIKIIEFSVVGNMLRGNFLKGIDERNSKYLREINLYKDLGYEVSYLPILLSTSSTVEENKNYMKNRGIETTENDWVVLDEIKNSIDQDLLYLISYSFNNQCNEYNSVGCDPIGWDEKAWHYRFQVMNKQKFLNAHNLVKNTEFTGKSYRLILSKYPKLIETDKGSDCCSSKLLESFKTDQIGFYKKYSNAFKGKQQVLIQGYRQEQSFSELLTNHGAEYKTPEELLNYKTFKSIKYNDQFSIKSIDYQLNDLWHIGKGDLTTPNNRFDIIESLKIYDMDLRKWSKADNSAIPPILNSPRRSFINLFDPKSCSDISYKNGIIINFAPHQCVQLSTKTLISKIHNVTFNEVNLEADPSLTDGYNSAKNSIFEFIKKLEDVDVNWSFKRIKTKLTIEQFQEFDKLQNNLKKAQSKYMKFRRVNKSGIASLSSDDRNMIKKDANWQSRGGYKLYMGEKCDLSHLENCMHASCKSIKFNFNMPQNCDIDFLNKLKSIAKKDLNVYLNEVSSTHIFNMLVFHSRLCYTLFATSNQNFSNKYIKFDNLGLTDTVLMVKGGKKITSTRNSKLFKLIYPMNNDCRDWNPKNKFYMNNTLFEETPWMFLHQQEILDGLALPYKYLMNYINLRSKYSQSISKSILFIPTMLALHNRRKTEQTLHNMRYLIVNALGVFSQVGTLIKEFSSPTYSPFDHAIYHGLKENYIKYYDTVNIWSKLGSNGTDTFKNSPIHHPFLNRNIYNIDDKSYVIYSTYMMTKGSYQQSLEQTLNLQSVMETHHYWKSVDKTKIFLDDKIDKDLLYNNDFSFSPKLSYAIGKVLSAEMIRSHAVNHIHIDYKRIMSEPVDIMANNRGLRYKDKEFFGHKGYYVIYKNLLDTKLEEILDIINSDYSNSKKYRLIKEYNRSFETEQSKNTLDKVVFHIVDKSQRAGRREIYVMDYTTKLHQNPIEKMFKLLCKFTENEIISIPASRRTQLIHKKNFEYKNDKYSTFFLTYDCRKWAPRSNTKKFIFMLDGMKEVLPDEFINDVKNYFRFHDKKLIKTRIPIFEQLNKKTGGLYAEDFTINETEGSASFEMPYSFVMGIFNMLSSLYHAGAQLLIGKEISERAIDINCQAEFNMLAHSDDSGGTLSLVSNDPKNHASLLLSYYQHIQKACNHLMSVKKCNTSMNYFELLSTLYMNDELLPLLPKFLSNFSATFTGMGISSDFKQIISKSIELQSNGCTGKEAYMCQLVMSNFYRSFYRVTFDTTLPALGGTADSWPTLYLAFGSVIDEIRVSLINPDFYMRFMNFATSRLDFEPTDGTVNLKMIRNIKIPVAYRDFKRLVKLPQFEDNEWFFSQNKTRNSSLNIWWFRAQIDNPNFAIAVLNINEIRRAYDSLYSATGDQILGKMENFNINELYLQSINFEPKITEYYKFFKKINKTALNFYEDLSTIADVDFENRVMHSYKPCQLNITNFQDMPITNFNSLDLAVQLCRPDLIPYLNRQSAYGPELEQMKVFIKNLDIPYNIKYIKSFLDYTTKFKNFTSHFYMRSTSLRRTYNGIIGVLDIMCNSYSQNENFIVDKRVLRQSITTDVEFDKKIIDRVLANYLYKFAKDTRDDDLTELLVKIGDVTTPLRNIPSLTFLDEGANSLTFINHIGNFEGRNILLNQYSNWAYWSDRQVKISGEWVGDGIITMKFNEIIMNLMVKNQIIQEIRLLNPKPAILTDIETKFFHNFIELHKLEYIRVPEVGSADFYLGLNKDNQFGFFDDTTIYAGVKVVKSNWLEFEKFNEKIQHKYDSGRHLVKINNQYHHLHTLDSLIYQKNKGKLFDIIDWQNLRDTSQASLLTMAFSGNYGVNVGINYDPNELKKNFRSTDLYNLFYNEVYKKKVRLPAAFWNDIITHVTASEDILPVMFENSQLNTLQKLIPESKKNTVQLYRYYNTNDKLLFQFRKNIMNFENESQQAQYIVSVLTQLGDNYDLAVLPEIGDEREFLKYKYDDNKMPLQYWLMSAEILSEAIAAGYMQLPLKKRLDLGKLVNKEINEIFIQDCLFGDLVVFKEQAKNYRCLTIDMMILHTIIDEIFENTISFIEFARKFRRTMMRNIPRHAIYLENWHILVANVFKYFQITRLDESDLEFFPPTFRKKKLIQKKPEEFELIEIGPYTGSPLINLIYETEELELSTYDKIIMNMLDFNGNINDLKIDVSSFEEACDEAEIEFEYKRRPLYKEVALYPYTKPTNFAIDKAIATRLFFPLKNTFKKQIRNYTYYVYNLNPDIAKTLNFRTSKFKFELESQKYLKYYEASIDTGFAVLDNVEVKFDIEIETFKQNFFTVYNLENPETYTEEFAKEFIKHFDIKNEKDIETVNQIISLKRTPITKGIMLRKIIKDINKSENDNLDELILAVLNEYKNPSKLDIEKTIKIDFAVGPKQKGDMLLNSTSYKAEYMQLKLIMGNSIDELIVGNLSLKPAVKRSLKNNLVLSISKWKTKDKEKTALLRLMKELVESCSEGQQTNDGDEFDEVLRNYLVEMNIDDEEEEEDVFDEPIHDIKKWRIRKG